MTRVDTLLSLAKTLSNQARPRLAYPVAGRIAYVVNHSQPQVTDGYSIRTQGIAKALNQTGWETLCLVRPGWPWETGTLTQPVVPDQSVDGVRYLHTPWPSGGKPHHAASQLKASTAVFRRLFSIYRPACVLAASNWELGLPAWVAATQLGIRFYNEVRGFWELSRAANIPGYDQSPAFKADAERDAFVARQASAVFTLNASMKAALVGRGVEENRIKLLPNAVSRLPVIKPADRQHRRSLGIGEHDTVIGYIGSINAYEGLELLQAACSRLINTGWPLKLLTLGGQQDPGDPCRKKPADTQGPSWWVQVGRVPHEDVSAYYALLDAVIIPRRQCAVGELVPPIKVAEALVHGKRLVVSNLPPLLEYANQYPGITSFKAGNLESLCQAIQASLATPEPIPDTELQFSNAMTELVNQLDQHG